MLSKSVESTERRGWRLIVLALVLVTLAVFWPIGRAGFINYDDQKYITDNPDVQQGLTTSALERAFVSSAGGYWHPLTWISHLVDTQLFGPRSHGSPTVSGMLGTTQAMPAGHHLHNLLLHTINTVLLWWVLLRITRKNGPAIFVAAMFAIHPTHVESVAWISERKDTLSVLFMLLCLWAYLRYTERLRAGRYAWVLLAFACALMSKPMMVTLPGVLLLLDLWPLNRIHLDRRFLRSLRIPLLEKLPMFAMSLATGVLAIAYTQSRNSFISLDQLPLGLRLQTAVVSYTRYLGKMVWPSDLTIFYPYPFMGQSVNGVRPFWPMGWVIACVALLVLLSGLTILQARRRPYLLVGWLWFVGMMLPVAGLLVTGDASMADRYTYTPFIGLFIAIAWLASEACSTPLARKGLAAVAATVVLTSAVAAHRYVYAWHDSLSIFGHALQSYPDNWTAHTNYGLALAEKGDDRQDVRRHFEEAYRLFPNDVTTSALASWHLTYGDADAAAPLLLKLRQLDKTQLRSLIAEGRYALLKGRPEVAEDKFIKALVIDPDRADARALCVEAMLAQGQIDDAERQLRDNLKNNANDAVTWHKLGLVLDNRRDDAGALAAFIEAIRLDPTYAPALYDYGTKLARAGQFEQAAAQLTSTLTAYTPSQLTERGQAELTLSQVLRHLNQNDLAAGHLESAQALLRQAIVDRPKDPVPQLQLALLLRQLKSPEALPAASTALEKARAMNHRLVIQQVLGAFPQLAERLPATRPVTQAATTPSR